MRTCNKRGEKGTWRKDPRLRRQTKPKKKGRPPRGKGTNHVLDPPPLTFEASKGNASKVRKIYTIVAIITCVYLKI
jgi:hypothetical protein